MRYYTIASIILLVTMLTCVGSAGATDAYGDGSIQTVIEEIDGQVLEMIECIMVLHNGTEKIADNETLDEALRTDAEKVHVASHDLIYIAEDIQEQVGGLKELGDDPETNEAEMGEAIEKIKEYLGDYTDILQPNHDLIDLILSDVPETHKAYAETASDAIYKLGGIADDIEENVEQVQKILDGGEPLSEIQEVMEEIHDGTSQLKKLTRKMNKPAHAIPGDTGSEIHVQFHRIEGPVGIICEIVKDLQDLAEEPEENREEMRELVVGDLWEQLSGFGQAVDGMSDLVDEIISVDPDDANAQELQEIIEELAEVQYDVYTQVGELGAKVQDPIVWEYTRSFGALNPHRLENGNTLICDCMGVVIEVTPDKEIAWKYGAVVSTNGAERLENGNTLISIFPENRVIEVGDGHSSKEQITPEELFESLAGEWAFEGSMILGKDTLSISGTRTFTPTGPISADFVVAYTMGEAETTETGSAWWDSEMKKLAIKEGDEIGYSNLTINGYESRAVLEDGIVELGISEAVVSEESLTILDDAMQIMEWSAVNMNGETLVNGKLTFKPVASKTATTLTAEVIPAISMTITTTGVDFGKVGTGMTSGNQVITVVNTGAGSAKVLAMMLDDSGGFYNESLRLNGLNIGDFSGVVPADTSDFRYEYEVVTKLVVPDWAGGKYDGTVLFVAETE